MTTLASFIKKEILLFVRNPQELLILIGMPFILITILGFSLGAFLQGEVQTISGKVALMMHSSEAEEFEQFQDKVVKLPLPEEIKEQQLELAKRLSPISMLKNEIFASDELQSVLKVEELPITKLEKVKKDGEYAAIIEVPEQFTTSILESLFIEKTKIPELTVYSNEDKEIAAAAVEDIVTIFARQYSVKAMLGQELLHDTPIPTIEVNGSIETLTHNAPNDAFSYYTVGMSVMFVLFLASTISSRTFLEKKEHIFDRILLANVPRWTYLTSVFVSSFVIAFLQLGILYGGTAMFYGVRWPNILAYLSVTSTLCMAIAGITVLLSAINQRLGSEAASKLFMNAIVSVLSFIGGSFIPVGNMSAIMEQIGRLTPNGAAMAAYLKVLQGAGIVDIIDHLCVLLLLSGGLIIIAMLVFPRRAGTV